MKKYLLLILVLLSAFCIFADSYSVKILNADRVSAEDNLITLQGNVILDITTSGNSSDKQTRTLNAQNVVINTETNEISASGSVSLSSDDLRDYSGDSLVFNWDSLDMTVYNGTSSIEKTNSESQKITFHLDGDKVFYGGDGGPVFMDGVILSTKDKDPYWSIEAGNIAILESDFVFKNAVVKLGRVPLLWVPFLYYPNTRLSFNPAVGISGTKGYFLNTTFELYGRYPAIWESSSSSSSSSDDEDDSAIAFSALSLLSDTDSATLVRDGLIYREEDKTREKTSFEKWVEESGSYLAIMADAYKDYGVALGIDSENNLFDSALELNTKAVLAYKADPLTAYYEKWRYAGDFSAAFKKGSTDFSFSIPLMSDPDVKYDFYNRNSMLQLDSLLGSETEVPSTYKSGINSYTWDAAFKTSFKFLNQTFTLSKLKGWKTFKWNTTDYEYETDVTVLPELDASLSGTIINLTKNTEKEKPVHSSNALADSFYEEYRNLSTDEEESGEADENVFNSYTVSDSSLTKTTDSYGISLDYKANTYLKDQMEEENRSFYFKAGGSLNFKANSPWDIFDLTESVTPTYVYTIEDKNTYPEVKDLKVVSSLTASSPVLGLTYLQTVNLYSFKVSEEIETEEKMKWETDYFKEHSLTLSRSLGSAFTISAKQQLKPLELIMTPSLTYKSGVYTITGSSELYMEDDQLFEKGKAKLEVIQKDELYNFNFTDTYDFSCEGWEGNSLVQNLDLSIFKTGIKLTEKATLKEDFKFEALNLGLTYDKSYIKMSFKDTEFDPDELSVHLAYTLNPVYAWYNRLGFATSVAATYKNDFNNKYGSSLSFDFSLDFALSEFASLAIKTTSTNGSFYRYYDEEGNFVFKKMVDDFFKSFDFFGNGRKSTGFNLSSLSVQFVHYMHDWSLNVDATASIETKNNEKYWAPEVKVFIKWNAIPELKKENTLSDNEWEY